MTTGFNLSTQAQIEALKTLQTLEHERTAALATAVAMEQQSRVAATNAHAARVAADSIGESIESLRGVLRNLGAVGLA